MPADTDQDAAGATGRGRPAPPEWLALCRRVVAAQRELFESDPGIAERTVYEGIGEGGDMALAIDRRCEDVIFSELERLAGAGEGLVAVSEERGEVRLGSGDGPLVVIDPIDGSLNARRTIPAHCVSIAVADGPSMAEVEFGYVYDFGASEEFVAVRGEGATVNGRPLRARGPGHGVEVVGLESADPEWILPLIDHLRGKAFRVRSVGAIAITLSYVAAARFDGMVTARPCRSVDAAAAQLIAREAGALVEFEGLELETAALDLSARYRLAAGLDRAALELMLGAQAAAPAR